MKKQNVTNRLAFTKVSVAELNDSSLQSVKGGAREIITTSTGACSGCFCVPVTTRLTIIVLEEM